MIVYEIWFIRIQMILQCVVQICNGQIVLFLGEDIVFLVIDINLLGVVDWVMMQFCFGYNFMLVLEKQEKLEG